MVPSQQDFYSHSAQLPCTLSHHEKMAMQDKSEAGPARSHLNRQLDSTQFYVMETTVPVFQQSNIKFYLLPASQGGRWGVEGEYMILNSS